MVQWFKDLITRIFSQPPAPRASSLIEWNKQEMMERVQRGALELFRHKTEDTPKIVIRCIEAERSIQLLELARIKTGDALEVARLQGRIDAYGSLIDFLSAAYDEASFNALKEVKKEEKSARVVRMRSASRSEAVL